MAVKQRLQTLRSQAGVTAGPERAAAAPDLRQRLARMRVGDGPGRARAAPTREHDVAALARALGARELAPGLLCVDHQYGDGAVCAGARLPAPEERAGLPGMPDATLGSLGFLDTETSGLAGGTGTVAFNIGLVRRVGDAWQARQYVITGFAGEAAMLEALAADVAGLAALATYNGGSFDLPLLRDRYRLHGTAAAPLPAQHVDLLHPVRRLFRPHWPDCRLATAEALLLGVARDGDLPGSQVPGVWFDWLHRGDGARMGDVLAHNRQDILSLLALLPRLGAAFRDPGAFGADALGAARAWLQQGEEARALQVLEAAPALDRAGQHELARLYRRAGRLEEAAALWQRLAECGCPRALEQLAKFHEHFRRDPQAALSLAERLPEGAGHERRRQRLRRRLPAAATLPLELEDPSHAP
ncbi:ribonuclease H-like domain-containing protein [Aquisalimonas lutea]|uniref:ribonuclease H-like domain-containing protein n=1 Tax=Aquisalimonas lutea TaxID=1327750 RepID=UPI0025B45C09|nr:ribonuclease H-like domain-containing protein [Aquisalimonas lutea]MDN3518363.1 ribonuclease H-like domain-containing protein [Aquisalimonas lutea]